LGLESSFRMLTFKSIVLILFFLNLSACEDRIFDNPLDPDASFRAFEIINIFGLDPSAVYGLTWDGSSLWACNRDNSSLLMIDRLSGSVIRRLASPVPDPVSIHYENEIFFIIARNSNKLYKMDYYNGKILYSMNVSLNKMTAIAGDGNDLFIGDESTRQIYRVNKETGELISGFKYAGAKIDGMTYWEGYLWVSDSSSSSILKIKLDGSVEAGYKAPEQSPKGLATDGIFLWNADASGKLFQLKF